MSQQPHRSQQVDYLQPSRMSLRRVFKLFLYFVGAIFSGFGLLGGALLATGSNKELTNEAGWVAVVFWLLILVGSIFIFFCWHFHLYALRWLHYLVLLLLITVGGIIALVLGNAFSPNPNNTASSLIFSYIVILYGVALIAIAFLKPHFVAAYAKGNLTSTPGGKSPDQLSLEQMIKCVKSNGIVTDDAVLSYLRQTRNDQAHGTVPTLAERRILMRNIQYLAGLYIDYIKFFDDLSHTLYSQPLRENTIPPPPPMGYSTSTSIASNMQSEMFPNQKILPSQSGITAFRVLRSILYFIATFIAACGLYGTVDYLGASERATGLGILLGLGLFVGGFVIFLLMRHRVSQLR